MPKVGHITAGGGGLSLFSTNAASGWFSARELLKSRMGTNMPTILPMFRFWIIILAALALLVWGAFRFFSSTQRQLKAAAARNQVADKTA